MSATMDVDLFSQYFNGAPVLYLEGRQHPIQIFYTKQPQHDYLHAALVSVFQIHQVWSEVQIPKKVCFNLQLIEHLLSLKRKATKWKPLWAVSSRWTRHSFTMPRSLFFSVYVFSLKRKSIQLCWARKLPYVSAVACKLLIITPSKKHIWCGSTGYNVCRTETSLMKHCLLFYMWCPLVLSTSFFKKLVL